MKKKDFREKLDQKIESVVNYFEDFMGNRNLKVVISIERSDGVVKLMAKGIDGIDTFDILYPVFLEDPEAKMGKPKSFQQVLDQINDFIQV